MARTGGELIVDALVRAGVRHAFGIAGVHNLPIYDAIHDQDSLVSFATRHEQGAAYMADGYARVSGSPGVALVTTGPGLTNTVTPLAGAWSDSVPLLVIGTAGELPLLGKYKGYLHEFKDQSGVMAAAAARASSRASKTWSERRWRSWPGCRPGARVRRRWKCPLTCWDKRADVAAAPLPPIPPPQPPSKRPSPTRPPCCVKPSTRCCSPVAGGPCGCERSAAPAGRATARPGAHDDQRQRRYYRHQPLVGRLYVAHVVRPNRRLPGLVAPSRRWPGGRQPLDRHGHPLLALTLAAHPRPPRPRRQRDGQELPGRRAPGRRRTAGPGNAVGCVG